MPPVLGPVSPSPDALVVLGRGQRQRMLPVDQGEEAQLLAFEEFLDDDFGSGGAEDLVGHHGVDRFAGLLERLGDDHALAGGEPVGLDHDRQAPLGDIGLGRARVGEAAIGRGRDGIAPGEVLHEAFGALQRGAGGIGPESGNAGRFQPVHQAQHQGRLGSDDDELDPLGSWRRRQAFRCRRPGSGRIRLLRRCRHCRERRRAGRRAARRRSPSKGRAHGRPIPQPAPACH